jgi:opacity protein-like surface antigen
VYYDLPVDGRVVPYLGGGIGYYHGDAATGHSIQANGLPFTELGGSSDNALLLVETGLSIRLDDHWAVVPAYRFQHLFVDGGPDIDNHTFEIGLRYSL